MKKNKTVTYRPKYHDCFIHTRGFPSDKSIIPDGETSFNKPERSFFMENFFNTCKKFGYECIEDTECALDAILLKSKRIIAVNPNTVTRSTMRDILHCLRKEAASYGKVN